MPKPVSSASSPQSTHSTNKTNPKSTHTGLVAGETNVLGRQAIKKEAEWQVTYKPSREVRVTTTLSNEVRIVAKSALHVAKRALAQEAAGEAPFNAYNHVTKRQKH